MKTCPICGGSLAYYTQLGLNKPVLIYCPKCDLTASRWMSFPYLCKKCYGEQHFYPNGFNEESICYYCGSKGGFTPKKEDWYNDWGGNFKRKLQTLPDCVEGEHNVVKIWDRETEDRPLMLFKCSKCGIEFYAGF